MLTGYRDSRITQQAPPRTALGLTAGEPSHGAAYQQQRAQTVFCDCRCMGTLAFATVPIAQNPFAAGAGALSLGAGAAPVGDAAGAGGADGEHPVLADGGCRRPGSSLGVGARAAAGGSVRG